MLHSMVVSLWDVTESLYIEISRSDGPQKGLADVDLTHLKSYGVIHAISIAVLGHSKSFWVFNFVSSHPKSSWVIKTSYVRGPPIQNPIYCGSVVTTTTLCALLITTGDTWRKSVPLSLSVSDIIRWGILRLYPLPPGIRGFGKENRKGNIWETLSHPGFENLMTALSIMSRQCKFFGITREPPFNQSK